MKLCNLETLFDVAYPKTAIASKQTEGDIPFVSSAGTNNGVSKLVARNPSLVLYRSGSITVPLKGTVLHAFLQGKDFYCAHQIAVLTPKKEMTKAQKVYYVLCIRDNKWKFNYGRQADRTLRQLKLPEAPPTWVESVTVPKIRLMDKATSADVYELGVRNWGVFKISDLFELRGGFGSPKIELAGTIPVVTSTLLNNGTTGYTNENEHIVDGPALTISTHGGGNAFYQESRFRGSSNSLALIPKFKLNKLVGLFLCTVINQDCFRHSYGRIRTMGRVKASSIKLPATPEGTPDWNFMEEYMKRLPGSANLK